jgi:hypothetical protein
MSELECTHCILASLDRTNLASGSRTRAVGTFPATRLSATRLVMKLASPLLTMNALTRRPIGRSTPLSNWIRDSGILLSTRSVGSSVLRVSIYAD